MTASERPGSGRRGSPRLWIVAALVVAGILAAVAQFVPMMRASTQRSGPPSSAPSVPLATTASLLAGAGPAAPGFAPLTTAGQPPGDVLTALGVPPEARVAGRHDFDRGSGGFDRAVDYRAPESAWEILDFYSRYLPERGWMVTGRFPLPHSHGREVLARRAGSDGNYWEVGVAAYGAPGVAVDRSTTSTTTPVAFQIRLQLVDDQE